MKSCVQFISRPRFVASATNGAPSIESSTPIIRPSPRTSRMKSNFLPSAASPSRSSAPRARTFSRSFSFSTTLRNSSAVAQTSGPPPNVEPCRPGLIFAATAVGRENRAERQSRRERLRDHDDVGLRCKFLIAEVAPSAPEPALNLVGDQNRAVFRRQSARTIPERLADRMNSAFALNRLQHHRANRIVEFRLEIAHIVELHKLNPRHERRERQPILFGRRSRSPRQTCARETNSSSPARDVSSPANSAPHSAERP